MIANHPFSATLMQLRKLRKTHKDGEAFSKLTEQQQWEWHADVYAYNRVVLGRQDSPADPEREFFDEGRIGLVERYYRANREPQESAKRARDRELQLEGRDIINRWAQSRGYVDLDAYAAAKGIEWIDAYREYSVSPEFQAVIKKLKARQMGMSEAEPDHRAVAAALGLSAKEQSREFAPTAEEMAASRRQLGIGEPAPEAAA